MKVSNKRRANSAQFTDRPPPMYIWGRSFCVGSIPRLLYFVKPSLHVHVDYWGGLFCYYAPPVHATHNLQLRTVHRVGLFCCLGIEHVFGVYIVYQYRYTALCPRDVESCRANTVVRRREHESCRTASERLVETPYYTQYYLRDIPSYDTKVQRPVEWI
jgi:hypothetical protein